MSATLDNEKNLTAVDAAGNAVDLSEFEESFYKEGEIDAVLQDYAEVFNYDIAEGTVIKGKILKILEKEVLVDINFKSEGIIHRHEFREIEGFEVGDEIDVYLEQIEDSEGNVILSKSRADFLKVWESIHLAYEEETIVKGKLLRRIKGGIVVDLFGVDAFLPGSQIDLRQIPDMDAILNETFEFRVIKVNKARRNIVVSRRVILEAERSKQREQILTELEKESVCEGIVKNITDFGAFIDLGGVDGLLHITDMSWGRVNHPSEIVSLGDTIKVMILDFDDNKERISLGLKQLSEHPWKNIEDKYPEGTKVRGKIVSITDYGAFMELEKGIEGLVHISEMSWTQHIKHPSKIVGIGDIVEAVVLKVDKDGQKISLGFKQLEPDPWNTVYTDFPSGTIVSGKIRNVADYGIFIELKEGVDGLVHISDMSWTKKITAPKDIYKKGDAVEVKILDIDEDKRRISLGIKQVTEDPWPALAETYTVGAELNCEIARILDRGVIVNLNNDIEGFIPTKELAVDVKSPEEAYKVGETIDASVIEFDIEGRKIVASMAEFYKGKDSELAAHVEAHPIQERPEPEASESDEVSSEDVVEEASSEATTEEA